jgi:hypothetical protein
VFLEDEGPLFDLQEDFDLCDAMEACVGHSSFNSYARGSSRIDFALCSPEVLPAIQNGGYESFRHHVKGNHRPLYLDLDTEQLFGNPSLMANIASRGLNSKDITNKQLYIKFCFDYLKHGHFFTRLGKLIVAEPPTDGQHCLFEALERDWVASALHTESLLAYKPSPVYVVKIARWRRRKNILALTLSDKVGKVPSFEGTVWRSVPAISLERWRNNDIWLNTVSAV